MSDELPTTCRACHRAIKWFTTPNNRRMPVDLDSLEQRVAIIGGAAVVAPTYVSHFATCPKAEHYRRKRS